MLIFNLSRRNQQGPKSSIALRSNDDSFNSSGINVFLKNLYLRRFFCYILNIKNRVAVHGLKLEIGK
jgi:hypothetical protein